MDVHRRVVHHDDTKEGPDPVGDDSMAVVESGVRKQKLTLEGEDEDIDAFMSSHDYDYEGQYLGTKRQKRCSL